MLEFTTGPVRSSDVGALARLHQEAFPGFFLSQLGLPFLREFYRGFVDDPSAVAVAVRDQSGLVLGAAVGTTEPADFYRRLLRRRIVGLLAASAHAIACRPGVVVRLARGALYRGQVGHLQTPSGALLSSICTAPEAQGAGLGRLLVSRWEETAEKGGATSAHLSTDACDNASVNAFYDRAGWRLEDQYRTREGRRMYLYTKDFRT